MRLPARRWGRGPCSPRVGRLAVGGMGEAQSTVQDKGSLGGRRCPGRSDGHPGRGGCLSGREPSRCERDGPAVPCPEVAGSVHLVSPGSTQLLGESQH